MQHFTLPALSRFSRQVRDRIRCDGCQSSASHDEQIQRVLEGGVQRKAEQGTLNLSQSNDALEHEADRVAEQVVSGELAQHITSAPSSKIHRQCDECDEELHRKEKKSSSVGTQSYSKPSLPTSGHALSRSQSHYFESRFGDSFDDVRIHNDPATHEFSENINARAFTWGNHIGFSKGELSDDTRGKLLLAHELTHVLQQQRRGKQIQRDHHQPSHHRSRTRLPDIHYSTINSTTQLLLLGGVRIGRLRVDSDAHSIRDVQLYSEQGSATFFSEDAEPEQQPLTIRLVFVRPQGVRLHFEERAEWQTIFLDSRRWRGQFGGVELIIEESTDIESSAEPVAPIARSSVRAEGETVTQTPSLEPDNMAEPPNSEEEAAVIENPLNESHSRAAFRQRYPQVAREYQLLQGKILDLDQVFSEQGIGLTNSVLPARQLEANLRSALSRYYDADEALDTQLNFQLMRQALDRARGVLVEAFSLVRYQRQMMRTGIAATSDTVFFSAQQRALAALNQLASTMGERAQTQRVAEIIAESQQQPVEEPAVVDSARREPEDIEQRTVEALIDIAERARSEGHEISLDDVTPFFERLIRINAIHALRQQLSQLNSRYVEMRDEIRGGTPAQRRTLMNTISQANLASINAQRLRDQLQTDISRAEQFETLTRSHDDWRRVMDDIGTARVFIDPRLSAEEQRSEPRDPVPNVLATYMRQYDNSSTHPNILAMGAARRLIPIRQRQLQSMNRYIANVHERMPYLEYFQEENIAISESNLEQQVTQGILAAIRSNFDAQRVVLTNRLSPFAMSGAIANAQAVLPSDLQEALRQVTSQEQAEEAAEEFAVNLGGGAASVLLAMVPIFGPALSFSVGAALFARTERQFSHQEDLAEASLTPGGEFLGVGEPGQVEVWLNRIGFALDLVGLAAGPLLARATATARLENAVDLRGLGRVSDIVDETHALERAAEEAMTTTGRTVETTSGTTTRSRPGPSASSTVSETPVARPVPAQRLQQEQEVLQRLSGEEGALHAVDDPDLLRAGYEAEIDIGNGVTYRRRHDGIWCRFNSPPNCDMEVPEGLERRAEDVVNSQHERSGGLLVEVGEDVGVRSGTQEQIESALEPMPTAESIRSGRGSTLAPLRRRLFPGDGTLQEQVEFLAQHIDLLTLGRRRRVEQLLREVRLFQQRNGGRFPSESSLRRMLPARTVRGRRVRDLLTTLRRYGNVVNRQLRLEIVDELNEILPFEVVSVQRLPEGAPYLQERIASELRAAGGGQRRLSMTARTPDSGETIQIDDFDIDRMIPMEVKSGTEMTRMLDEVHVAGVLDQLRRHAEFASRVSSSGRYIWRIPRRYHQDLLRVIEQSNLTSAERSFIQQHIEFQFLE